MTMRDPRRPATREHPPWRTGWGRGPAGGTIRRTRLRVWGTLLATVAAAPALAQPMGATPPAEPLELRTGAPADAPPAPGTGDWDWVQMKNGEWLKGEIVDVQDDDLVFDSDEFDELNIDLNDVYAVYSPRVNTIMLLDKTLVEGTLTIQGDTVTATTVEGKRVIAREEIRSIIPGRPTELNFGSGKIGLGASIRRGNVDQTDLSATLRLQRRTPGTRLGIGYDGAYSLLEGQRTTNVHLAGASYDVYLTERLYLRAAQLTYFRDEFQNVDYRITPAAGFGYDVIDRSGLDWSVGAMGGWEFERFIEVPPGAEKETDSASVLAFSDLEWEATPKVDVGFRFDITVPVEETSSWNSRATVYTEVELWADLDLDVQLVWDHNNNPAPDSTGSRPEEDDVRLFVGMSFSF